MNKKRSKSTMAEVKTQYEYIEVPVEITFMCPERGEVTQTVMVKKYRPQGSPIPMTR